MSKRCALPKGIFLPNRDMSTFNTYNFPSRDFSPDQPRADGEQMVEWDSVKRTKEFVRQHRVLTGRIQRLGNTIDTALQSDMPEEEKRKFVAMKQEFKDTFWKIDSLKQSYDEQTILLDNLITQYEN